MSLLDSASLVVTPNGTKASKLYSVVPSSGAGDLDVTRATTATRVNSSGLIESVASNVPRLDYTNGSCPSILVEPQRTNISLYSEQFNNAYWGAPSNVIANTVVAPDGTTTADTLTGGLYRLQLFVVGAYVFSFYAKKNAQSTFSMRIDAPSNFTVNFNFDTGTADNGATMVSVGNGWFRCLMPFTSSILGTGVFYPNVGGNNFYIWGAQLEAGSYGTSYIPTTSASVTRNADVISKTGISSLIGQTEGTMFVDFYFKQGIESFIIGSGNGSYFNNLAIECYSNKAYITIFNNSASLQGTIETTTLTTGKHRLAVAYNSTQVIAYLDGVSVGTLGAVTFPSFNNLYLGNLGSDTNPKNTNINTASIWKTRLTNTQLATLTTI